MRCPSCSARLVGNPTICPNCHHQLIQTPGAGGPGTLAPAPPAVHNPYRTFISGFLLAAGLLLGLLVASLLLGANMPAIWSALILVFSAAFLIVVGAFALMGSAYKRNIRDILEGEYWAHWSYSEEEWARFTEESWARARRRDVWVAVGLVAGTVVLALIAGAGKNGANSVPFSVLLIVFMVFFGALFFWNDYSAHQKRRKQKTGDVYISHLGVYRPEGYAPLDGVAEVKLRRVPRAIVFTCRSQFRDKRGIAHTQTREVEVPVPHGNEDEAAQLVQQLQMQVARKTPSP